MARTLRGVNREFESVASNLQCADNGNALFIGFSGLGKTTTISNMLSSNMLKNPDSHQEDLEEKTVFFLTVFCYLLN